MEFRSSGGDECEWVDTPDGVIPMSVESELMINDIGAAYTAPSLRALEGRLDLNQ